MTRQAVGLAALLVLGVFAFASAEDPADRMPIEQLRKDMTDILSGFLAKGQLEDRLFAMTKDGALSGVTQALQQGAAVDTRDKNGNTPLLYASMSGYIQIGRLLVEKGANVNCKNKRNVTALMLAAVNGYPDFTAMLLEKSAEVNAATKDGLTALMYAAASGRTPIVKLLVAKGADIRRAESHGYNAAKLANLMGYTEIAEFLQNGATGKGSDLEQKSNLIPKAGS
jgi:ankyrin repeat protein